MIYLNGNTYRTLDQKFYIGNKQVGKVYHGDTLVYPEQRKENEIPTEGGESFKLEGKLLNGNIYDTGFAPSVNTCVEICFANKTEQMTNGQFGGFAIFGTHQDVYYGYGGENESYNSNGGERSKKWGDGYSYNGWNQWKTRTSYHFILNATQIYFRFGGEAVQDSKTYVAQGGSFSDVTAYNTSKNDTQITVGSNYWNTETTVLNLKGKYFTITADYNYWRLASGVGSMYTGNENYLKTKFKYSFYPWLDTQWRDKGTYPSNNYHKYRADYNFNEVGGNLWIGTQNRNYSSTTDAVEPNKIRNHYDYQTYKTNPPSSINFDTDINTDNFTTGKLEWVYVLIQNKDLDTGEVLKDSNGKYIKYLYIPKETTIADANNSGNYYIAFEKYETSDGVKWNTEPSEIIFPFAYIPESL